MKSSKRYETAEEMLLKIDSDEKLSVAEKQIAKQKLMKKMKGSTPVASPTADATAAGSVSSKKRKNVRKLSRKRLIVIITAAIAGLALLVFGIVRLFPDKTEPEHDPYSGLRDTTGTHTFVWWEGDKTNTETDKGYLQLDRTVYYCDPDFGLTLSVSPEYLDEFDAKVQFLYGWIMSMIQGDARTFNSCFTDQYLGNEETVDKFSPTALYNITITKSVESTSRQYKIEMMVYRNDGSLINRVDSDRALPFYVVLVPDGSSYLIDRIFYPHYDSQ